MTSERDRESVRQVSRKYFTWAALPDGDVRTNTAFAEAEAALEASITAARAEERERLKEKLSLRLNNHLVEMKSEYDDSIVGFNEAWDVMLSVFNDADTIRSGQ